MTKVRWGSFRVPWITSSGPANGPRGDLGEIVISSESQNVVPPDLLALHMVEFILVIQASEGLNFVMDLGEHDEEAPGVLLVVWAAFCEVATNIFVDTGIAVIGCHELSILTTT